MATDGVPPATGGLRGWAAALAVVVALVGLRLATARWWSVGLPRQLRDLLTLTTGVLVESLPFVLLGIVLSIMVQVWLPEGFVARRLPRHPVLRRLCLSLLGVLLPVCECGNVPLARGLLAGGLSPAESLVFLLAAPILNPVTILTTWQAFPSDPAIVVARVAGGLLIANLVGWLASLRAREEDMLLPSFAAACAAEHHHDHGPAARWQESLTVFRREAANIMPALVIGSLVAGGIQVAVPRGVLLTLGGHPVVSVFTMMLLAFIVSLCSNVDAFFALAFRSTFTAGSLASFLVFGPVIDVKMLSLMRTTYRTRTLVEVAVIVALASAALGMVVNYAG